MADQKVIGADTAEINTTVIVAVAVIKSKGVVVREGSGAKRIVHRLIHSDRDAVNAYLQSDDAARGHRGKTTIGTDTGARNAEKRRIFAGRFGFAEHSIET